MPSIWLQMMYAIVAIKNVLAIVEHSGAVALMCVAVVVDMEIMEDSDAGIKNPITPHKKYKNV